MHNRHRMTVLLALALVAACDSGGTNPEDGPVKVGIVSGNNQVVVAAPAKALPAPIVAQLVRLPNGTYALLQNAADFVLPTKAYAQGIVLTGSPIPGGVVCGLPADSLRPLKPMIACVNTGADGKVSYPFSHGTVAGESKGIVQASINGVVVTLDTARATVVHGPVAAMGGFLRDTAVTPGQVIDFTTFPVSVIDYYGNRIPQADYVFTYRRVNRTASLTDAAATASRMVTVRTGDTLVRIFADTVTGTPVRLRNP